MMKSARLGCLTTSGIMASLLTVLIIAGFGIAKGGILFNPGPLNAAQGSSQSGGGSHDAVAGKLLGGVSSHAEIAGQCGACHAPFWSATTMADRCVVCHIDVSTQWQDASTLHGVLRENNPNLGCRNCHPDHRGPDSPLIDLNNTRFPHNSYGYSLSAHHAKSDGSAFSCNDCHARVYTGFDQAICSTCHTQVDADFLPAHNRDFGTNCLGCHDGVDSFGSGFDHGSVRFQLTGKHIDLACKRCHTNAGIMADLIAAPQDCKSCHKAQDPHLGRYGTDCGACHTSSGWTPATFDHNLSTFKLDGKHVNVACETCHNDHIFQGTPTDCNACHRTKDPHTGSLGQNCASCHATTGWKPAIYDHNLSTFILTGKHTSVACIKCHVNNTYKGTSGDCNFCHKNDDNHNGLFGSNCATCHSTTAWKPSTFDHGKTSFILSGAHTSVACASCHVNNIFKGTPGDCYSCHKNIDKHSVTFGTSCGICHNTSAWKPATFDHNLSTFKLTGAHTTVACTNCHVSNVYEGTPGDCNSCHKNDDKHAGGLGTNCSSCHTTSAWKPATFDHNLSTFKLTGAHATMACASCHVNDVYKGTPSDCYSCHKNDDNHGGRFGTDCGSCHTTSAWKPATFDHNLSTFKLTGAHSTVDCGSCHVNSVYKGTPSDCYSCHKKDDNHGGNYGTNCGSCHATNAWKPATFDHNLSTFKLTGAHTSVVCSDCHVNNVFKGTPSDCYSCHKEDDNHDGSFGLNCGSCHSTSAWKPATFDHNSSGFPLTGAHVGLSCSQCHSNGVYGGLSTTCVSCHNGPDTHAGLTTDCTQCHSTSNWNASFTHPGGCDGNCANHEHATCAECHPVNYSSYTCAKCHDRTPSGDG
jgi:hypothetical protein